MNSAELEGTVSWRGPLHNFSVRCEVLDGQGMVPLRQQNGRLLCVNAPRFVDLSTIILFASCRHRGADGHPRGARRKKLVSFLQKSRTTLGIHCAATDPSMERWRVAALVA